jgi:hypothetical protein
MHMHKTMKTKLLSLILIASVALVSGCTTVSNPDNSTSRVPDVAQMQAVAQSAAFLGTEIWLNGLGDRTRVPAHPDDRTKFVMARDSLRALIAAGTFSSADLKAVLQQLPIKELQGSEGVLIVGEVVILWDRYGRQLASLDKAQVFETYILPVAQSILDGLNLALGPPCV